MESNALVEMVRTAQAGTEIRVENYVPRLRKIEVSGFGTYDGDIIKSIDGVLLGVRSRRSYFADEGDETPTCYSNGSGRGSNGEFCARCPLARYNDEIGRTPCREKKALLVVNLEDGKPWEIPCPTSSLRAVNSLFKDLAREGISLPARVVFSATRDPRQNNKSFAAGYGVLAYEIKGPVKDTPQMTPEDEEAVQAWVEALLNEQAEAREVHEALLTSPAVKTLQGAKAASPVFE